MDKGKVVFKKIKCCNEKNKVYFLGYDENKHKNCCLLNYAKTVFKNSNIEKISLKDTLTSFEEKDGLVEKIKHNDIILLCGCKDNKDRQFLIYQVLKSFRNNNIIVFIDNLDLNIKEDYNEVVKNHTNLHLFVKEDEVLQKLKNELPETKIYKKPTDKKDKNIINILKDAKANKKWFKTIKDPKISICVPVYNVEKCLEKCLNSIINQTYKNIEIICVEGGSTDNSPKILEEYAKKDNRVIILKHDGNKGLLAGRKTAVAKATGDYVVFVDSDDYIVSNACKILANTIEKHGSSIIAFDCNIINLEKNNEEGYKWLLSFSEKNLKNRQKLYKEEISQKCLAEQKPKQNIWNKAYRVDICKKAYALIPNEILIGEEDLFAIQYLYYFANDMVYIDKKLYNYSYEASDSTADYNHEENLNKHLKNIECIVTFLNYLKELECVYQGYFFASENMCIDIIKNKIMYEIMNFIPEDNRAFYINKLLDVVGESILTESIFKTFYQSIEKVAPILQKTSLFKNKTKQVKNIGIFYHRLGNGGVERVIQKITPLLIDAGFSITIFVEEKTSCDYEIDNRADIVILPRFEDCHNGFYTKSKIKAWKENVEKYNIDTVMYQASSYQYMFYDVLILNTLDVHFITTAHELFCQAMCFGSDLLPKRLATIKCVDFIQTLSKTEETFWTNLGVNAKYIINPLTFNPKENKIAKKENNLVLWVGRLDYFQKKPKDAIDIFKMVYAKNKDARMIMLGKGENEEQTQDVLTHISMCDLDGVVENIYDNDVKKYYEKTSVLLMTSTYESAPMVLGEAMSFGLPVVSYDMPYVEMLQENEGVVCIAQRDMASAAQQITSILNDKEKRNKMGEASKKFIDEFSNQNPLTSWLEIFKNLPKNKKQKTTDKNYNKIIEEIIYEHYTIGINEIKKGIIPPPLSFFARAKRCLKVNGVWGTFKKVVKKSLGKAKRILKRILCKNKNTSK